MNSGFTGQVGQEWNLQPAVLEVAAPHPRQSCAVPYSPVAFHRIGANLAAVAPRIEHPLSIHKSNTWQVPCHMLGLLDGYGIGPTA
jgi:hypothetical protein